MRLLTYNISGLDWSNEATSNWNHLRDYAAIISLLRERECDFIAIQEATPLFRKMMEECVEEYQMCGKVVSHCGECVLYMAVNSEVLKDWTVNESFVLKDQPSVVVHLINQDQKRELFFVTGHLEPGKCGKLKRVQQVEQMVNLVGPKDAMICCGDFNVRKGEIPLKKLQLKDAKEEFKSKSHYTWNSFVNKYHANGFPFNCRFDVVYTKNIKRVLNYEVIEGKIEIENYSFYLSDHFAIYCELEL